MNGWQLWRYSLAGVVVMLAVSCGRDKQGGNIVTPPRPGGVIQPLPTVDIDPAVGDRIILAIEVQTGSDFKGGSLTVEAPNGEKMTFLPWSPGITFRLGKDHQHEIHLISEGAVTQAQLDTARAAEASGGGQASMSVSLIFASGGLAAQSNQEKSARIAVGLLKAMPDGSYKVHKLVDVDGGLEWEER